MCMAVVGNETAVGTDLRGGHAGLHPRPVYPYVVGSRGEGVKALLMMSIGISQQEQDQSSGFTTACATCEAAMFCR